jgi:DNA-binding beta-propeller fold protein YncE
MRPLPISVVVGLLLFSSSAFSQGGGAPAKARATAPEIAFESVPNFFKLPAGLYMGEGTGVATNSKGHVFVYTRSGETRLFEFDQTGAFVKEFGVGSYGFSFAHAVRVDKDDNVWAVDEGTNVVQKFSPDGKLLMVLGKRPDPLEQLTLMPGGGQYSGANRPYSFHRETDIGWDPQGNIFVTDGYGDSRVVKYDKNGRFVKSVGVRGSAPTEMNTPHSIAADAQGNLYVADRGNARIQVFDPDGKFLRQIKIDAPVPADAKPWMGPVPPANGPATMQPNTPWTVCITPGPTQYIYTSDAYPGRIYKLTLDGKLVGMLGRAGRQMKQFGWIHEIACPSENELYVGELLNWRMQKLILHPAK